MATQARAAQTVNIHEAKTNFSRLVADVEAGGEVVIARAGKPVIKLVRVDAPVARKLPRLGGLEHVGWTWDESGWTAQDQKELEDSFYDSPLFPDGA